MEELRAITPLLVALLGAGGIIGGLVALMKLRPEAGQIVVTAAQGALIVQGGVIKSLEEENKRLRDRVEALEAETTGLHAEIADLRRRMGVQEGG